MSTIGPLVAGAIFTVTNDYRKAFWFCLGMIALGALVLLKVDVGRGKDQAHQFVKDKRELKEQKQKQCSSS
ncbi:hypothetical protein BGX28_007219 [Mortierella sp. GBA30]|nr:hypothetical protein BGX28_007219 [Mortierella sp. GBA30]